MKTTFFLLITFLLTGNTEAGNIVDDTLNAAARKLFNQKVESIYKQALFCPQLEIDNANGKSAIEWMDMKPSIPDWRMLTEIQEVAYQARDYAAQKNGKDKVKHCFAGCFVRKKLDFKSAVMVGWLKELSDASDCTTNTHFEEADYLATVAGAIAGKNNYSCEKFCQRDDIKNATGEEMLDIASRENNITFPH